MSQTVNMRMPLQAVKGGVPGGCGMGSPARGEETGKNLLEKGLRTEMRAG